MSKSNAVNFNRVASDSDSAEGFEVNIAARPAPIWFEYGAIRDLHAHAAADEENVGFLLGSLSSQSLSIRCCEVLHLGAATKSNPKALLGAMREFINARRHSPLQGAEQLAGFFRTQATGWPEMRESDREIAKRHFRGSASLFLLIQTPAHRPWSAVLFDLDSEGVPSSKAPSFEFPFDEYLLRNGYLTGLVPVTDPTEAPTQPNLKQPNKRRWIIATVLLAILLGGSAALYKWRPEGRAVAERNAPSSGVLKLKVVRSGKDFEVSWDRLSTAVLQASGGKLTITDGALSRVAELDGAQLREGQILYTPLFEELTFRLEVATPDLGSTAESVQVLAWSGKQTADTLTVAPPDPLTNSPTRIVANDPVNLASRVPTPSVQAPLPSIAKPGSLKKDSGTIRVSPPAKAAPAIAASSQKQSQSGKQQQPATPSSSAGTVSVIQAPPPSSPRSQDIAPTPARTSEPSRPVVAPERSPGTPSPQLPAGASSSQPQANPPPSSPPAAPAPKPAGPTVNQNPPPASAPSSPPAVAPAVASGSSASIAATPTVSSGVVLPVAIQRVNPVPPRNVLSGAPAGVARVISVRVMVDSAGSVQSAEVVSSTPKGAFGEALVKSAALDAAKKWKFRPGQLNGKNVAAEYLIDFKFQ